MVSICLSAPFPADWRNVQSVQIDRTGLVKLSVPLETLDAARPGLEDLRLYDDSGRELPFLLQRPVQSQAVVHAPKSFHVTLNAASTVAVIETGLNQPIEGLTLDTPARDFLKAASLEASTDGQQWQTLAQGEPIFHQPEGASKLHIAFKPGTWHSLRLTLDDRRAPPIPLTGARLHAAEREPAPAEALDVRIVERDEGPGQTRFTLQAAGANVTLAGLELETTEPLFTRTVTLAHRTYVENEVRETVLARDTIYRVAVEGQPAASHLAFAVDVPVPTRELILTIQNGDSPPLPLTAVRARRRPVYLSWLANQAGTVHLLSRNAQCAAPQYDRAALPKNVAGTLVTPRAPALLSLNPAYRVTEALPELAELGSAIDLAKWKYRKRLQLTKTGVQQVELDLEALARTGSSFADLRLVRAGQQLPYLLERTSFSRSLAPTVEKSADPKRPTVSRWRLRLPHAALPITQLTCDADAPFFKREASLTEQVKDDRGTPHAVSRGQASWVRNLGQKKERLTLHLSQPPTTDQLVLEIDNGDNPPLELKDFQAYYPATRLLFKVSPDADAFLYYGNKEASFPRYDIDLVARQLLAAEKSKAALGAEEVLKKTAWGETLQPTGAAGWIFWIVLGGVVVALLILIARLLPKSQA
ncbi:MAG: DUF3999 family protein [Verrucomicrobia bacterium]|nr:DUF3999 family protein [Verrucomicrobiota bacterium]